VYLAQYHRRAVVVADFFSLLEVLVGLAAAIVMAEHP